MKIKIGILMLLAGIAIFSSCNNNKTYADMKKDQKKALDKFFTERNIEILHKWPADSTFADNQFLLLDNGVYINVIDSGNGNRATLYKTKILMRCSGERIFKNDTAKFNTFDSYYYPIEFTYGYASTVMSKFISSYGGPGYDRPIECYYLSPGVESILQYVGENAVVKLIVPFDGNLGSNIFTGSTYQTSSNYGAPLYYDKVRFQFY